ncbi:MAG TPA: hypothetical protein VGB73_13325 [Pyrinomonadaceae bacterium]|jgi:hypothetical protein
MQESALPDRLTVIAIAVIAYAGVNITHQIIGHCGVAALLGNKCLVISSTYIPRADEPVAWKDNVIIAAGSIANWAMGLVSFGILRTRQTARPALRYFLWLSMCVNLFLASTYVTVAPLIKFGDSYILIQNLPNQLFWRGAIVAAGAAACWLSFRVCRVELGRLIGHGGGTARGVAWELATPAYVAGGVVTVASGLFSQLEFKVAQFEAAGGTFGLTAWLLLLPLLIPEPPTPARHPFIVPRSVRWIVAGALTGLTFIGVLGPGIPL